MAGAKGVIISIIGGEDMRLLEVDEAANHIRELVDEDANIIWGSAFNPDLKGKIRVSVVATGIEQSAIGQSERSQPISLGGLRAPKRPVLELSEDEGLAELPPLAPEPAPEPASQTAPAPEPMAYEPPVAEPYADDPDEEDTLDLGGMDEGEDDEDEDEVTASAPFELTGMQPGDDYGDEYEDDVDGIVDPLAGLRGADGGLADGSLAGSGLGGFGQAGSAGSPPAGDDGMLDLGESGYGSYDPAGPGDAGDDDLLASADRLAAEDGPVQPKTGGRRRPLLGGAAGDGGSGGGGGSGAGSTLFERMANLSRSTARDDDEDDDDGDDGDGGPALSIPRFLGRQNNQ
jgi:cell division protein FtsZ